MPVFIALYRGINVGGRNSVKMELLRALHEALGHRDVASYIQSGNVVFSAKGAAATIGRKIAAEFAREFGFESHVLVLSAQSWQALVKNNPYAGFAAENPKAVHAAVCDGEPDTRALQALLERVQCRDEFVVRQRVLYLHAPDGIGKSMFAARMERAGGVPMTVRNWRTVQTLQEMAESLR